MPAYIGLGANLGNREATLGEAVARLGRTPGVRMLKASRLRETKPLGPQDQPDYLNGVVKIETELAPEALLTALLDIERSLGRIRGERWGPRTVDLDILTYGDRPFESPVLRIPHPELPNRPFLLDAIKEIDA
jgi:2-amino-4-hydroxy-6-hydroxymethyldihydropteridine diphosphokinase